MAYRKTITNRLRTLADLPEVSVRTSKDGKTVSVKHGKERSLDFKFRWLGGDHFAGYFVDSEGSESQAVLSLWKPMDAVHFASSYALLVEIRAGRRIRE